VNVETIGTDDQFFKCGQQRLEVLGLGLSLFKLIIVSTNKL
jgi:hypothetical protein